MNTLFQREEIELTDNRKKGITVFNTRSYAGLNSWAMELIGDEATHIQPNGTDGRGIPVHKYTLPSGAVYTEFFQTIFGNQAIPGVSRYLALKDEHGRNIFESLWNEEGQLYAEDGDEVVAGQGTICVIG